MRIPGAEIMSENEETLFTLFFLSSTFSKAFAMRFDRIPDYVPVQIAQMEKKKRLSLSTILYHYKLRIKQTRLHTRKLAMVASLVSGKWRITVKITCLQ